MSSAVSRFGSFARRSWSARSASKPSMSSWKYENRTPSRSGCSTPRLSASASTALRARSSARSDCSAKASSAAMCASHARLYSPVAHSLARPRYGSPSASAFFSATHRSQTFSERSSSPRRRSSTDLIGDMASWRTAPAGRSASSPPGPRPSGPRCPCAGLRARRPSRGGRRAHPSTRRTAASPPATACITQP